MNIEKTNEKVIYEISQWTLLNGAKKLEPYNFITDIGGKNNGYGEVIINIKDSCVYYLEINYVSYDDNLSFKIDINGMKDNKIYYVNFLKDWSINSPLTYTLPLILKSGENKIKFYGNENNNAPYLENFTLSLPPTTNNLAEGILENNAYIDYNTRFVNSIGGPFDGSSTISIKATNDGMYNLSFKYIIYDKTRPLKLVINGIEDENIYYISLTKEGDNDSIKSFTIPIVLHYGNNTIKFHGDGLNYAPNLGNISINPLDSSETSIFATASNYKISSGTLGNDARLDKNNIVNYLGGLNDGFVIVKVPIKIYGDYILKLNYINNSNNNNLKIDINGMDVETIYNIKENKTGIFSVTLPLVVGINKLKFYGDGINNAPDLGDFSLELIKDNSSVAFLGRVFNNASILPTGVISSLGGVYDGAYIMKYVAESFGQYDIYATLDASQKSVLVVNTNKTNKGMTYEIQPNDSVIVKVITLFLEKGVNNIIFHGDNINNAPNILKIEVKLMLTIKDSIYNLTEGVLGGGAALDENKKFITNLGGIDDGSVEIKVNIANENLYNLNINYLSEWVDSPLRIDITGDKNFSSNTICVLPGNKTDSEAIEENYGVFIKLAKGINNIKFHGNELDKVPKLSYIKISEATINQVTLPDGAKVFSKTYLIKKAYLSNGCRKNPLLNNFIEKVGGTQTGEANLTVIVPSPSEYKIDIKYLKINDNEKFKINFDGRGTGEVYNPPKTVSLKESDAKIFTVNMFLKDTHGITFYGDGTNNAPLLGDVTITEIKSSSKKVPFKINDISLENGAKKYNGSNFINSIGGPQGGRVILSVEVSGFGWYNFGFKYISAINSRVLNIYINKKTMQTYTLPVTKGWQIINAQTFTIPISLVREKSTIILEGDGENFAPIIGNFNLEINPKINTFNYDVASGTFKNGAKVNSYGVVTNIGGPKKGEALVKVKVEVEGIYELSVECMPIENRSFFQIFTNDLSYTVAVIKPDTPWTLSDIPIFKTRVLLKKWENIIIFRGDNSLWNYAGFLGKFSLRLDNRNYISSKILPKGSYDITTGTLTNGAFVFENFVEKIGGPLEGAVTITVSVDYTGLFNMQLEYRAIERSFLMIDVDGEFNGNIYVFSGDSNCNYINIKEIFINLKRGKNKIKFYGLQYQSSPSLSIVSLREV